MYTLRITTWINASAAICFDLARSIDAHLQSAAGTGERVGGGKTSGLLGAGDQVTWEAKHLGLNFRLSSQITEFRPPGFFQDRMTRGPFRFFEHDHHFDEKDGGTMMIDVVRFTAPFGPLGWIAERLVLGPHLRAFLIRRAAALKTMGENAQ